MATPASYSRTQITLHWIIAALVIFQILNHDSIVHAWHERMSGAVPNVPSPNLHALTGILIFVLVLWRLWLRVVRGVPALPEHDHPLLKALAQTVHWVFYLLLLGMPLSGATAWFAGLPQPAIAHSLAEKLLIPLILLHVAAALTQHFVFRSNVLKRMVGMA